MTVAINWWWNQGRWTMISIDWASRWWWASARGRAHRRGELGKWKKGLRRRPLSSHRNREKWFLRHSVVRLEAPVVHDGSTKKVLQLGQSVRQWLAVIDRDEFHRLTRFSAKPLNDSSQSWPPATPLGRYRYRPNPISATAPAVASATILCQLVAFKLWYRHRFHFHFSLLEFTTAHSVRHLIAAHWRHSLQLLLHTTLVVFLPFFLNWTNPRTVQLTGSTNCTTDN